MDKNIIITYETLYEILRREKVRKELQKMDENFFQSVIKYLEEKKSILKSQESKDSIFASQAIQKTRKEVENIQKIIKELYDKRESKIIQLAIYTSRTGSKLQDYSILLKEEHELYNSLLGQLSQFRKGILNNLIQGKEPKVEKSNVLIDKNEEKNTTIRFIEAVPEFLGTDLKKYGPYEAEDIANLPKNVSELLIAKRRAEKL